MFVYFPLESRDKLKALPVEMMTEIFKYLYFDTMFKIVRFNREFNECGFAMELLRDKVRKHLGYFYKIRREHRFINAIYFMEYRKIGSNLTGYKNIKESSRWKEIIFSRWNPPEVRRDIKFFDYKDNTVEISIITGPSKFSRSAIRIFNDELLYELRDHIFNVLECCNDRRIYL